jgi:hypothetical protein
MTLVEHSPFLVFGANPPPPQICVIPYFAKDVQLEKALWFVKHLIWMSICGSCGRNILMIISFLKDETGTERERENICCCN